MFSKKFQRKYALTDQGLKNTKKGAFWTVIVNLVVMGGVSILYLMMSGFMGTLTGGSPLPGGELGKGWKLTIEGDDEFKKNIRYYDAEGTAYAPGSTGWPSQGPKGTTELRFGMEELANNPDGTERKEKANGACTMPLAPGDYLLYRFE